MVHEPVDYIIEEREEHCFTTLDNLQADQRKYFLPKAKTYPAVDTIAPPNR